jgi:hypothetical protein
MSCPRLVSHDTVGWVVNWLTPAGLVSRPGCAHSGDRTGDREALGPRPARGHRSPAWDLSPHTIEFLPEHGFGCESSMMADDYGDPSRLVEMPISWTLLGWRGIGMRLSQSPVMGDQ